MKSRLMPTLSRPVTANRSRRGRGHEREWSIENSARGDRTSKAVADRVIAYCALRSLSGPRLVPHSWNESEHRRASVMGARTVAGKVQGVVG